MAEHVDILDLLSSTADAALELLRLDESETAVIPFTKDGERVVLHYCSEQEIGGYALCNGEGCLLCAVGRRKEPRVLLPVYLPTAARIAVLPVSTSLRPNALLPQLAPLFKAEKPLVAFLTRTGGKFTVSTAELKNDMDGGESVIRDFQTSYEAGNVQLASVFPRISNEELGQVGEIAKLVELKGIK